MHCRYALTSNTRSCWLFWLLVWQGGTERELFVAAMTLHNKICSDFNTLNAASCAGLRTTLVEHLAKYVQYFSSLLSSTLLWLLTWQSFIITTDDESLA